jgi:hypothetical protein
MLRSNPTSNTNSSLESPSNSFPSRFSLPLTASAFALTEVSATLAITAECGVALLATFQALTVSAFIVGARGLC